MFEKLSGVENRFLEVESLLGDPKIVNDREAYQKYSREHGELNKIVSVFRNYKQVINELVELRQRFAELEAAET
ncbi:MAG: PCRF domain-containing protein, partial [Desulfobacterales bacterium]